MNPEFKTIREHIARAKAYINRMEVLKTLESLTQGLAMLQKSKIFGRERYEVEILIDEVLRTMSSLDAMKNVFPGGLRFKRGQEKALYATLTKLHETIQTAIQKAEKDKLRSRKNEIDKRIKEAQSYLDQKEFMEARKIFRRTGDQYANEPGINQDIGSRLLKSGLIQESIEYFHRAIEQDSKDSRPHSSLIMAYEAIGELEKAEETILNVARSFGASDQVYMRLANLYVKMRRWGEAYDAAQSALEKNPLNDKAKKLMAKVEPRVFGRTGQEGASSSEVKL